MIRLARAARSFLLYFAAVTAFISSMFDSGTEGAVWFVGGIATLILIELQADVPRETSARVDIHNPKATT